VRTRLREFAKAKDAVSQILSAVAILFILLFEIGIISLFSSTIPWLFACLIFSFTFFIIYAWLDLGYGKLPLGIVAIVSAAFLSVSDADLAFKLIGGVVTAILIFYSSLYMGRRPPQSTNS